MGVVPTEVLHKVTAAVVAALVALSAIALTAVWATRSATTGADRVESEFAERVDTDAALLVATENLDLAEMQLRTPAGPEAERVDARLAVSDSQLGRAITIALAPSRVRPAETEVVRRVRAAYDAYLARRGQLLREASGERPPPDATPAEPLRRSIAPLKAALMSYAAIHFGEANRELRDLREAGRGRKWLLAITLAFGALSLLGIAHVARGIVTRVRGYSGFTRQVASGDLTVRLQPQGRDELTGLAHSLNGMVEQLASADRQRREMERQEADYRAEQDAFSEVLQVTESENEAHDVLTRHIERTIAGSTAVVLSRNHHGDRLEVTTPVPENSWLCEALISAEPRDCLAVRLARPHDSRGPVPAMLACKICARTTEDSTCVPLLVGGEVIGSLLVCHEHTLEPLDERRLHESVGQAAPVLANLRMLAEAEHRAATDALTGLPNRRAAQDTLKRMFAQSARGRTPLAAIMVDLDHFKEINDTLGHECGDTVLAAVGVALPSTVRASDFVARVGGEEFLVLLPETTADAALDVAEALRAAVAGLALTGVDRTITASLGVAVHPDLAATAETLLRVADRALYAAKANGRDRVEIGEPAAGSAAASPESRDGDLPAGEPAAAGRRFSPSRDRRNRWRDAHRDHESRS